MLLSIHGILRLSHGNDKVSEEFTEFMKQEMIEKANFIAGPQLDYGGNALVDLASDSPTPEIVYSIGINELEPNGARTGGYRLGKFAFKQFARPNLDNDYPIVRLGDVHLMHAEATARAAGNWA